MKTFGVTLWIAISAILSACSSNEVTTDYSACQMEIHRTPRKLSPLEAKDFTYSCMISKGYLFIEDAASCKAFSGLDFYMSTCFDKPSIIRSLSKLLGK